MSVLFSPLEVGSLKRANRIVIAPFLGLLSSQSGHGMPSVFPRIQLNMPAERHSPEGARHEQ